MGVLAHIPVILVDGQMLADLGWVEGDTRLLLILRRPSLPPRPITPIPLYTIGCSRITPTQTETAPIRMLRYTSADDNRQSSLYGSALWMDLYLVRFAQPTRSSEPVYLPMNHAFPPLVRINEPILIRFFNSDDTYNDHIANAQLPWLGYPPLTITFVRRGFARWLYAALQVGTCAAHSGSRLDSVWANIQGSPLPTFQAVQDHQCPEDHVLTWPHLTRVFSMETSGTYPDNSGEFRPQWFFTLKFVQCGSSVKGHLSLVEFHARSHVLIEGFDF